LFYSAGIGQVNLSEKNRNLYKEGIYSLSQRTCGCIRRNKMSKAKSGFGNINGRKGKIVVAVLSLVLLSAAITMMWSVEGQVHNTHNIQGYVTYEDGTPIGNALVNITIINSSNGR